MARQAPLLGRAFAVNPRSPQGRAGRREGLTAKARAELQWSPGQYAANVTAFSVDPSFLVDVPITFVQLTPRRRPLSLCGTRHITLYPVGTKPVPRSLVWGIRCQEAIFILFHSFSFSNSFVRPRRSHSSAPAARSERRRAQRRSRMARLRATASAARSVLDGREHDGRMRRLGSDTLRIAGSRFPQSGEGRGSAHRRRERTWFDVTCDAAIAADKIRGELAIEVGR